MSLDVLDKIHKSLLKRDSKEKNISLCRIIDANDRLVSLVEELKTTLDNTEGKLSLVQQREKLLERRVQEQEILLKEKDKVIQKLSK